MEFPHYRVAAVASCQYADAVHCIVLACVSHELDFSSPSLCFCFFVLRWKKNEVICCQFFFHEHFATIKLYDLCAKQLETRVCACTQKKKTNCDRAENMSAFKCEPFRIVFRSFVFGSTLILFYLFLLFLLVSN